MIYCLTLDDEPMFGASPSTIMETQSANFDAVVDTGATANFISSRLLSTLSNNKEKYILSNLKQKLMVKSADGQTLWVKQMISFKCIIESEPVNIVAFVADWLKQDCILGVPFKERYKDIAIPIISREVKLITTNEYFQLISAAEARRELSNSDVKAHLFWISSPDSDSKNTNAQLAEPIFKEYSDVLVDQLPDKPAPKRLIQHLIDLVPGTAPVARRPYRMSAAEKRELEKQLEVLLRSGRIEQSTSPFAAPVLFVNKKDGTKRLCCDFRGLNDVTVKSKFPLPRIDDLFDQLSGASTFSQLDLAQGYHQVEVKEEDQYKTSFVTHEGQYIWKVMPFGLTNAPSTFQLLMNETLKGLIGKCVLVYLDDILVYSKSRKEHLQHLRLVMNRLREQQLFAKKSKCHFFMESVNFLGHTIDADGIHVDNSKVKAMVDWPEPKKPVDMQSFLGTAGFYRKFIKDFSAIANPLYAYGNKKKEWDKECSQAFKSLKDKLVSAPVLLPFDETKEVLVTTDASDFAIGATLELLGDDGKVLGVVAYLSAKLSGAELKWPVREKEGFAIRAALEQWSHYLKGKHFVLNTDHQSLKYLATKKDTSPKIGRWLDVLAEYDFDIVYIKGEHNRADGLSRRPDLQISKEDKVKEINSAALTNLWMLETETMVTTIKAITPEYIATLKNGYTQDIAFKIVYDVLSHNLPVPPELRTVIKRYKIKEGLLYYGFNSLKRDKLCIPDNEVRAQILKTAHDSAASAHCDAFRTFLNISQFYHWPKMQRTINDYVKTCHRCQRAKLKTGKPFGTYTPLDIPDDRWRGINIDFISGMEPDAKTKNDSVMVVTDRFSKMSHFIAVQKTATTEDICNVFIKEIFRLHGAPRVIVSDRDKLFTSALWDRFAQRLGIKLNFTTSHNPQADGQVERVNRTLAEKVSAVFNEYPTSWEEMLPMIEFAYNNTYQATIKATPFLAAYAFHPRFVGMLNPIEPSVRDPFGRENPGKGQQALLDRILRSAEVIREIVTRNIAAEQERISIKENGKKLAPVFKVGDQVLLDNSAFVKPIKGQKFQFKWYGPFEITEKISENNYRLATRTGTVKHDVYNVKVLKPYHNRMNDYGRVSPMTEEAIESRLSEITGFGEMRIRETGTYVETKWRDCEDWDTTLLPIGMVEEKLPEEYVRYLKQHRNRRNWLQERAIEELRVKWTEKSAKKNRRGRPAVNPKRTGKKRGNNRF